MPPHTTRLAELPGIHGVMAEFDSPEHLIRAAKRAYAEGYRRMDAYAPMPVEGLAEAIGYRRNWVAPLVFVGGSSGAAGGFFLLYWIAVIAYPHNVGGRPYNSWPSFIPITFECMVLLSAITAVFCMLLMNGLPMLYHPVFNIAEFAKASKDSFFLCIESSDPLFRTEESLQFLRNAGGSEVTVVPA